MDKKNININNLENFLEKAKNKINEGIEDIGEKNMNLLEGFFIDVKKEKEILNNYNKENEEKNHFKKKEIDIDNFQKEFDECAFEVVYKKVLYNEMSKITNDAPFDIDTFKKDSNNKD